MGFGYWPPVGGGGGVAPASDIEHVFHTITGAEATAKQFNLPSSPLSPAKVLVFPQGGTALRYVVDYDLSGTTFSWSGKPLDGILDDTDVIEFWYPKT